MSGRFSSSVTKQANKQKLCWFCGSLRKDVSRGQNLKRTERLVGARELPKVVRRKKLSGRSREGHNSVPTTAWLSGPVE